MKWLELTKKVTMKKIVLIILTLINLQVAYSADLTVSSVSVGSSEVQTGNTLGVTFTVINQGLGNSEPFAVGIYISTTRYGVQKYLDKVDVSSLSESASTTLSKTVTVPADLASGTYYIDVFVDYLNQDQETNENNNIESSGAVSVTRFAVSSVTASVTPSSLQEGELLTRSGTLSGSGTGTVTYHWEEKLPGFNDVGSTVK